MQNYRYDEFLDTLEPVLVTQKIKVPASGKFYVKLKEFPLETQPSTILVRDTAATDVANPDQDCSVFQGTGANNNDPTLYTGRSNLLSGGFLYRAFLRFDITALPSSPSKVLLRLFCNNVQGDSLTQNVGIYRLTSAWTETGPTWGSQPTYDTDIMGQMAIAPRADVKGTVYSGWYESDVTELYNQWKSGTNHGLMLKADESIYSSVHFASSESGANQPQLVVVEAGGVYRQVAQSIAPTGQQFACSYPTAKLRFPATAAGLELDVDYLAIGSAVDSQDVGSGFKTAGTADAFTITSDSDRIELVDFLKLIIRMHAACNAGATLNPDGWGDIPLQIESAPVGAGDLILGGTYLAVYDEESETFQVIGATP